MLARQKLGLGFANKRQFPDKNSHVGSKGCGGVLFVFCGTVIFLSATTITLMIPFYSMEAESRGVGVEYHGFVLGTYQLVMLLVSPIYGKLMGRLGPVKIFQTCSLLFTIGLMCFGTIEVISNRETFLFLSFVFRVVQSVACTGIFAAAYVMISVQSTTHAATMFASLQTFVALGIALGPTFGGALYDIGGFSLPFFTLGSLLLISRYVSDSTLVSVQESGHCEISRTAGSVLDLVRIPSVILSAVGMVCTAMTLGFICTTLEPHLRQKQFSLTATSVGLIQAVNGGASAITAPLWGLLCDKAKKPLVVNLAGHWCVFTAFLIIGPALILPINTILWLTVVGLALQGIGVGASFVSTFSVALQDSRKHGFTNDMPTYALICTLWQSTLSLGIWLGASASGLLVRWSGFRESSGLFLMSSLVMIMLLGLWLYFAKSNSSEDQSCLEITLESEIFNFVKQKEQELYGSVVTNLQDDYIYNVLTSDSRSLSVWRDQWAL